MLVTLHTLEVLLGAARYDTLRLRLTGSCSISTEERIKLRRGTV